MIDVLLRKSTSNKKDGSICYYIQAAFPLYKNPNDTSQEECRYRGLKGEHHNLEKLNDVYRAKRLFSKL